MDVVSRNCSIVYCFAGRLPGAAADFVAGGCAETRAVKSATIDAVQFMGASPEAGIIALRTRDVERDNSQPRSHQVVRPGFARQIDSSGERNDAPRASARSLLGR